MNASSEHVYDSDKKVKGRKNKFYFKNKFKQVDTGKEESVSSSYLSLSGHDSGVTWQSSMSYASVGGAETLSDLSSGYLSVDENPGSPDSECDDSKYDDSCNSGNNCFSCFLDGIETLATHMCQTCRPEKKFICHKCLQQHNKFCEEHDVISLSVIYEQRTEPNSNSVEQTYNSYDRYDQAVILKAKNIHKPVTDWPNQKDKMQESGKKTLYETVPMDHRKYSEHQLTISPEQSAEPSTDSTDEFKRSSTHMVAKPMGLSVPLRHVDKASQTYFSDELKHSSVEMGEKHGTSELFPADSVQPPTSDKAWADYHQTMLSDIRDELKKNELNMDEKPCVLSLFSTDNDSHKNKDGEGDIAFQEKAPSTVRNKNEINQCHLQKDRPVDRRKVKASFTETNKNKRNQCHVQSVPELEKEIPHTGAQQRTTTYTNPSDEDLTKFHQEPNTQQKTQTHSNPSGEDLTELHQEPNNKQKTQTYTNPSDEDLSELHPEPNNKQKTQTYTNPSDEDLSKLHEEPNNQQRTTTYTNPSDEDLSELHPEPNNQQKTQTHTNPSGKDSTEFQQEPNNQQKTQTYTNPSDEDLTELNQEPNNQQKTQTYTNPSDEDLTELQQEPDNQQKKQTHTDPSGEDLTELQLEPNNQQWTQTNTNPSAEDLTEIHQEPNNQQKTQTHTNPSGKDLTELQQEPNNQQKTQTHTNPSGKDLNELQHEPDNQQKTQTHTDPSGEDLTELQQEPNNPQKTQTHTNPSGEDSCMFLNVSQCIRHSARHSISGMF